jgi:uroporphyrinogen III methyltransferase/synthase
VTIVTGHECGPDSTVDWGAHARSGATLVVLMGMANLDRIVARLLAGGRPEDEPVVVIERATQGAERSVRATLSTVVGAVGAAPLRSPAVIVVGAVAALHDLLGDEARTSVGA